MMPIQVSKYTKIILFYTFFIIIGLNTSLANATDKHTSVLHADIIKLSKLSTTLDLAPALIDSEISKLENRKFKLNKKKRKQLKQALLIRFHPHEVKVELLKKLESSNAKQQRELLNFYKGSSALTLTDSQITTLNPEFQNELISYKDKVAQLSPQAYRKKLMRVYDDLNNQSLWQALLIAAIQETLYQSLSPNNRQFYTPTKEEEHYKVLSEFNNVFNLYSFRFISSDKIVQYLDDLNNNKKAVQELDLAFRDSLLARQTLIFKLK